MRKLSLAIILAVGVLSLSACGSASATSETSNDRPLNLEIVNKTVNGSELEPHYYIDGKEVTEEEYLKASGEFETTSSDRPLNLEIVNKSINGSELEPHYYIDGKEVTEEEYLKVSEELKGTSDDGSEVDEEQMIKNYEKKITDSGYSLDYERYEITGNKEVTFYYSDKRIVIDECNFCVEQ